MTLRRPFECLGFDVMNNKDEHEALLARLRLAQSVEAKALNV